MPEIEPHRCSGCGHRWTGPLKGAELCGDCWRTAQTIVFGRRPGGDDMPDQAQTPNRLPPQERYLRDAAFHWLVDTMRQAIEQCEYTPTELREAAILAATLHEAHRVKRGLTPRLQDSSGQPCGCDRAAGWICAVHRARAEQAGIVGGGPEGR